METSDLKNKIIRKLCVECSDNHRARELLSSQGYSAKIEENQIEIESREAIDNPESISTLLVNHHFPPGKILVVEEELENYFLRIIRENDL